MSCADPEKMSEGVKFLRFSFFLILVDEGRENPNTTISGSSSALQRNDI